MLLILCQPIVVLFRRLRIPCLLILLILSLAACSRLSGKAFKPGIPGYREHDKKLFVLNKKLLEISGQVSLNDHQFVAIEDEDGKLNFFGLSKEDPLRTQKFAGKGDYEDIAKTEEGYYVLESNGDLFYIDSNANTKTEHYKFKLEKKIEFESLVYYPSIRKLILITKDHALSRDAIYGYSFDIRSRQYDERPYFIIPKREILRKMKDYSAEFKPSGAALHPITGKLFLLASIGKQIIICSPKGQPERAYDLNPDQFQQPEGISFASNGDMYISNEGLQGKATILKFPYHP